MHVLGRGTVSPAASPQPGLNSSWLLNPLHSSKGANLTQQVSIPHLHNNQPVPGTLISIPVLHRGLKWEHMTFRLYNSAPLCRLQNAIQFSPWIGLLNCNPNCLKNAWLLKFSVILSWSTFVGLVGRIRATGTCPCTKRPEPSDGTSERSQSSECFQCWWASGSSRWVVLIRTSYLLVEVQIRLYLGKMTGSVLALWSGGICPPDSGLREFAVQALGFEFKDIYWWALNLFSGGHIFFEFKIFPNHREIFPLE